MKPTPDPVVDVSYGSAGTGTANIDNTLPITITILKVDKNNHEIKLGKAEFKLTKVQAINAVNQVTEGRYEETGITSDADDDKKGTLEFAGLTPGFYYLKETKAPAGYVMTEANGWHFQIDENGIVSGSGDLSDVGIFRYVDPKSVTVENTPGVALPATGGAGTRLFTILGSILILGAGVLLWRRRRIV